MTLHQRVHITITDPTSITPEVITHGADAESITITNSTDTEGSENIAITVAGPLNHEDIAESLERYAALVRSNDE